MATNNFTSEQNWSAGVSSRHEDMFVSTTPKNTTEIKTTTQAAFQTSVSQAYFDIRGTDSPNENDIKATQDILGISPSPLPTTNPITEVLNTTFSSLSSFFQSSTSTTPPPSIKTSVYVSAPDGFYGNREDGVIAPGPMAPGELMRGERSEEMAPLGLLAIIVVVVVGNLLVCAAVKLEKRLHRMTFYFFISMAIAHVLMACTAMPPAVLVVLAGHFTYQEEMCKLWVTLDLFLCNNTCLHLAFCTMDTFLRVKDPLRHNRPNTTCSLLLWLGAPWVISSVQAIAQFMLSQADHGIVHNGICFIADKNFLILGTLFSFMIPSVIAVVFYVLSYYEIQALRRGKYLEESDASTRDMYGGFGGSHESLNDDMSETTSCVSDSLEHHQPVLVPREQVQLAVVTSIKDGDVKPCNGGEQVSNASIQEESTSFCEEQDDIKADLGGQNNLAFADHIMSTDQSSSCTLLLRDGSTNPDDQVLNVEREHDCHDEALRHEIIINKLMFLLLLCCITLWIPFSVSNIVYGVCDSCRLNMTFTEMLTFKWLAYSSAMVGPFVYAKYSDAMREAFYKITTCKYCPCS